MKIIRNRFWSPSRHGTRIVAETVRALLSGSRFVVAPVGSDIHSYGLISLKFSPDFRSNPLS